MEETWMTRHLGGICPYVRINFRKGRNPLLWWTLRVDITWLRTGIAFELSR
jgi:hypothetical protein